jgi:hypothetical protein
MNKKNNLVETIKISVLLLVFGMLVLLYTKLNSIQVALISLNNEIKKISTSSLIINQIEESYASSVETIRIREAILSDLYHIAAFAQQHYRKPKSLGGGENSFLGFEIPIALQKSKHGVYKIEIIHPDSLKIKGSGYETGADEENPIEIELEVNPKTFSKTIIIN